MKKIIILLLYCSISTALLAKIEEGHFNKNISADYGIYTSMNGIPMKEMILGRSYSLQYAQFLTSHKGFKTGIIFTNNLCGNSKIVTLPFYFAVRTIKREQFQEVIYNGDFGNFIASTIWSVIPKNFELNIGPNIGYSSSGSTVATYGIPILKYTEGWTQKAGMFVSMDVVGRLKICIGNFGLIFSPSISYLFTKNLKYQSTDSYNYSNGYKPAWFFRGSVGISYSFSTLKSHNDLKLRLKNKPLFIDIEDKTL